MTLIHPVNYRSTASGRVYFLCPFFGYSGSAFPLAGRFE
nr:MAG TPA: hypothetical protein [Caudoviricetes sp.]